MAAMLGSVLLIVASLIIFIYLSFFSPDLANSDPDNALMQIRSFLGVAGRMLLVVGLVALYVRHSEAMGIVGLTGFLLTLFGLVAGPGGAGISLLANLGWALFGVSSLQARVYPRIAAIILIIGALITAPFSTSTVSGFGDILVYAGVGASTVFDVAIIWLGFALFTGKGLSAEQPEQGQ